MTWLVYIPWTGSVDGSVNTWLNRQLYTSPYCLDCGYSRGKCWVKIKA